MNVYSTQYGFAGGSARWSSCEERGFIDEWTSHVISYSERATTTPTIRHYTRWTKAHDVPLGATGGSSANLQTTLRSTISSSIAVETRTETLWSDPNFVLRNPAELRIESPRSEYAVVSVWFRR